jgi:hypothetical protein
LQERRENNGGGPFRTETEYENLETSSAIIATSNDLETRRIASPQHPLVRYFLVVRGKRSMPNRRALHPSGCERDA